MSFIIARIRWIMLASGLLTLSMVQALLFPEAALQTFFGEAPGGPASTLVIRNWGALIALMGALLIWGAVRPDLRRPALVIVGASKIVFIALVLSAGGRYLTHQAGIAIAIDAVFVALFAAYLLSAPKGA